MLQACGDTEREQETVWVCRAAGQESQDKGKEAQMEVLELKLSCIPKIPKTNIHQRGLYSFNENHVFKEGQDFLGGVGRRWISVSVL